MKKSSFVVALVVSLFIVQSSMREAFAARNEGPHPVTKTETHTVTCPSYLIGKAKWPAMQDFDASGGSEGSLKLSFIKAECTDKAVICTFGVGETTKAYRRNFKGGKLQGRCSINGNRTTYTIAK